MASGILYVSKPGESWQRVIWGRPIDGWFLNHARLWAAGGYRVKVTNESGRAVFMAGSMAELVPR